MDSEPLPPIPTPVGQRWRELRIRVLPVVVFVALLAALPLMWTNYIQPVGIVGQVETNAVNVATTQAGLLTMLAVNRFDEVTNGQILGEVAPYDAEQIAAELAATASTINLLKARMDLSELGNVYAATQMRLSLDAQQTALNVARVNLELASNVVARDQELMKPPGVVTPAQYELDVAKRNALKSEVVDRSKLAESWGKELDYLAPARTNIFSEMDRVTKDDMLKQQEQLRQLQKPIVLRAPINGKVSAVNHRSGERVMAGAPILTLTSGQAQHIVAYVRQPINYRPKLGDVLLVRTRTSRRKVSEAQVVQIGTELELISPMLIPIPKPLPEIGLPIALTLPPELNLLPGEIVDIRRPTTKN